MQKPLRWFGLSFEQIISALLILYVISTACLEFPLFPPWSHRIQPSELIFVLGFGTMFWGILIRKFDIRISWNLLDLTVFVYLFINLLSACFHPEAQSLLEVLGKLYLGGIYLWFKLGLAQNWLNWKKWITGISLLSLFLIISTFWGYGILLLNGESTLLVKFEHYPYFGTVYRAKGMLQTPSMYISLVNWCFLFLITDVFYTGFSKKRWLLLIGLILCAILSLAKAVLLLGLILCSFLIYYFFPKRAVLWISISAVLILVLYIGFTNMVYLKNPSQAGVGEVYLGQEQRPSSDEPLWVPTSYFAIKQAAVVLGTSNPILGVGPGNFIKKLNELQQAGKYPAHLPLYDPHSVWFGAFAEIGILGLLGVSALLVGAFQQAKNLEKINPFRICFLLWILVFTIEGFNGDLMNFRHYWIAFGLIGGSMMAAKNTLRL